MAAIDVSDLLADPDFADSLTLVRGTVDVDGAGMARTTEATSTIGGVVQSGTGDLLKIGMDAAQASGGIAVYTTEPLHVVQDSSPADALVWRGRRYTVQQVSDWGNYGAGYNVALCTLQPVTA
jgi:hypothetical protein